MTRSPSLLPEHANQSEVVSSLQPTHRGETSIEARGRDTGSGGLAPYQAGVTPAGQFPIN